jgi:WD40 repeat protein
MSKKITVILCAAFLLCAFPLFSEEVKLLEKAVDAQWTNTGGSVLKFGVDGKALGTVKYEKNVRLETGDVHPKVLHTQPQWIKNGQVRGLFKDIAIPDGGGKLLVGCGFLESARGTDGVRFAISFIQAAGTARGASRIPVRKVVTGIPLWAVDAKYDGKIDQGEVDLTRFAGQKGSLLFVVNAGNSASSDFAVWTKIKLLHGEGAKPEPAKQIKLVKTLSGHGQRIYRVNYSPNGRYVVTASGDRSAKIWDVNSGRVVANLGGHKGHVFWAAFSPNGQFVATAGGNSAKIWRVPGGGLVREFKGHTARVHCAVFAGDNNRVITTSEDGTAAVWRLNADKAIRIIKITDKGWVYGAAFHPRQNRVALCARGGHVALYDAASGNSIHVFRGHSRSVATVHFNRAGDRIVTASDSDNTARVWNANNGSLVRTFSGRVFESAAFHPNGKYIVTGNGSGVAIIWNIADGKQVLVVNHGGDRVKAACFSPNGKFLVTAGDNNIAKIWELSIK